MAAGQDGLFLVLVGCCGIPVDNFPSFPQISAWGDGGCFLLATTHILSTKNDSHPLNFFVDRDRTGMVPFPIEGTKLGARLGADVEKSRLSGPGVPPWWRCRVAVGISIRFRPGFHKEIGPTVPVSGMFPPFLLGSIYRVFWLFVNC